MGDNVAMRGWSAFLQAVAVFAAMSSCQGQDKARVDSKAEPVSGQPDASTQAPANPAPTNPAPANPAPTNPAPTNPAPATLAKVIEGLDVAWFDPTVTKDSLELLCNSDDLLARGESDERTPCAAVVDSIQVVDAEGTAPWTVRERSQHLQLVRAGARFPDTSAPLLALLDPPPAKNARLSPVTSSRPKSRSKKVVQALVDAVAEHDDIHPDNIPLRPRSEVHGAFGDGADTLVVFAVDPSSEEFAGLEVLAAFAGDQLQGVFGDPMLMWSGLAVAGMTDLDGDGISEVLWWGFADGIGVGLFVTWFANGEFRRTHLYSCECGEYFLSAYPGTLPER